MEIIYWILIVYGTTQIIAESYAFKWFRDIWEFSVYTKVFSILFRCVLCTSTWISFIYSKLVFSPFEYIYNYKLIMNGINISIFLDGMFGSAIVWLIYCIENRLTK